MGGKRDLARRAKRLAPACKQGQARSCMLSLSANEEDRMELKNRRVLITGGTSGIGHALAQELGARGANVMICSRDPARLDAALAQLPGALGVVCDVGCPEALPGLIDEAVCQLGGLDLLINNAGIQLAWNLVGDPHPAKTAADQVAREIAVDLTAPILLCHLAVPHLVRGDAPAIVNVTSVLARQPKPSAPVYSAAKAGLRSFTRSLRSQLRPQGIRVIELVPPLVDTAMTRGRDIDTISPATMAQASVAGLLAGSSEIRVGKARVAAWLDRLVPGLLARMMARA
ncbi:MAG: SDR family NAD(P)-dependent oxidoreductase, partial [Myxococcales bacterium]|nr:SDR family NAD(P)-dependent oxidoreductase [Myxococcales bacterium]